MHENLKELMPQALISFLRNRKHAHNLGVLMREQSQRFIKQSGLSLVSDQARLAAKLIFYSHRIEKGLSHSKFRAGFGTAALKNMSELLRKWNHKGYSKEAFEYTLALSALGSYYDKHISSGTSVPTEFGVLFLGVMEEIMASDRSLSGVRKAGLLHSRGNGSYPDTLSTRSSIREYGLGEVDEKALFEAMRIAMSAPSVCNRQPQMVTVVNEVEKIQAILDAQGGWRGYEYPPILLIVTSRLSSFLNSTERNEPYTDGGIFLMALLGAIEWVGLAACPLNAMFELGNEAFIRNQAAIPDDEVFIALVTVGNMPDEVLCPRSARRQVEDVVRFV